MKLGKLAPKWHPHTLSLAKYLAPDLLPDAAAKVYREYKTPAVAMQLFGNDRYGDCVFAMFANFLILATVHTGTIVIPSLADVLKGYSDVTGFDPATGANDNGTVMTEALEYMRNVGMAGHKILGWAKIDHHNIVHRRLGVQLFGATLVGVSFPASAMTQFGNNQPWHVDSGSTIEGGHAILHPGYGATGDDYVTWGKWDQKAASSWSLEYVDEEYVAITEDWIDKVTGKTPGGLDLATLQTDLKTLTA